MRGLGLDIPDSPTIIDIGANAGFFSLFAASRFPGARIFSYEPIEGNFRQLQRNRDLNRSWEIPQGRYNYSGALYNIAGDI